MKNNKDKETKVDPTMAAAGSKIDAIKEIIFGQNIREYDEEFAKIREEIGAVENTSGQSMDKLERDIMSRIDDLEKALTKQIESNHKQLLKEVEQLSEKKTDRKELGKMLIQIGNKLSS